MSRITYDMEKLSEGDALDTSVATRFFYSLSDYFDKLTEYTQQYTSYIHHYNPTVVVVSEAERQVFIADCASVRALLTQLGMDTSINALNRLENAAMAGEIKELSDSMIIFQGMLTIAANHILAARRPDASEAAKKKIALVHDADSDRAGLTAMLEGRYAVLPFSGGADALRALDTHKPDLFLLFAEMKTGCGYELAFYIREREDHTHTPILFLTGTAGSPLRQALPDAAARCVPLPVEKEALLKKIEGLLAAK